MKQRSWIAVGLLSLAALLTLAPFVWLFCASLKTNEHFFGSTLLPLREQGLGIDWSKLSFENYRRLFQELDFARALANSVFLSSVTGLLATFCCAAGGYALARFHFRGRGLVTACVLGAMLVPAPLLLAPGYQLLHSIGLLDSLAGLVIPAIAPAFGIFLFRQASLSSVPVELLEAARIDGCSEFRTFTIVALPLIRPMIGTFLMMTFLGVWNNFITPQVVLQSPERFPLSVAVAQFRGVYYQDYGLQMAGTVIGVIPVLILFLALQREFVSGLTSGALKG